MTNIRLFFASLGLVVAQAAQADTAARWLWELGKHDTNTAEFALAPASGEQLKTDAFFAIGKSEVKRDWPYAQPGPEDMWAANRQHTFTIVYGLKGLPSRGECRLAMALVDTHKSAPPKLRIQINGKAFEQVLPKGAGDASFNGHPEKGQPFSFEIPFSSDLLRTGDNDIQITTVSGSWLLYDWIGLQTPAGAELRAVLSATTVAEILPVRALNENRGRSTQPVSVVLKHLGKPENTIITVEGAAPLPCLVTNGEQTFEVPVPAVSQETDRTVRVEVKGKLVASQVIHLKPVRKLTVFVLPHSHTDIGYTEIQSAVADKQVKNLIEGIAAARRTANYPEGARFVWNVEVLWAADLYLNRLDAEQQSDFFDAVKKGQVVLNGMYLNELTGLCRPEELGRLFRFATSLAEKTGVPIDTAMISDVPGYTWGTVPAMSQAGIKYFSTAPNYFDRIGTILTEWENKPFYWVGPDGKSKVLVWIPFWGYAMSHRYNNISSKLVEDFSDGLDNRNYPYDIAYVRWSGHGDNASPDPAICDTIKDWNSKYTWPHFVIAGTGDAFRAFEQRFGAKLPVVRGDWTPYWEDGAGSSALETMRSRQNSDRLTQAETAFAMLQTPSAYPAAAFDQAWKNVLLYSEHTWGAWCSVNEPERKETLEQWAVKKSYVDEADTQSRQLLQQALTTTINPVAKASLDVLNTLSWPRTELVTVSSNLSKAGDRVIDQKGNPVASQRLRSGDLVFLATDVPPLAASRYSIVPGTAYANGHAIAQGATLDNGVVHVDLDTASGGVANLTIAGLKGNLIDTNSGETANDYLYLQGDDLKDLKRNGPVKITVGEQGPLVASLFIDSEAPGCAHLQREVRITAGQDYVGLINHLDKTRLPAKNYRDKEGKESVNFAFPFNVPDGEILVDLPLGAMRPELDQMPSACKNWLTVGRWAEVSNGERGVTWVTLDAPLIEVGGLTAILLNSQTNPDVWRKTIGRTQKFYSWAMNNHWGTNYRAYQEGPHVFRFVLRPHGKTTPAAATRFATGFSQPLLAQPAMGKVPAQPLFQLKSTSEVIVSSLKPSDDGKGWIIRLFGASGKAGAAQIQWGERQPTAVYLSDTSEKAGTTTANAIPVAAYELVTLRAEF